MEELNASNESELRIRPVYQSNGNWLDAGSNQFYRTNSSYPTLSSVQNYLTTNNITAVNSPSGGYQSPGGGYSSPPIYETTATLIVNNQPTSITGIPRAATGSTWYQSFTAENSAKLTKFAFATNGSFSATADVTIREGEGVAGNILHSGTWTGLGSNTNSFNEYEITNEVLLTSGQKYTIQLENQTAGGFIGSNPGQYNGGMFYYSGYSGEYGDLKMKIWGQLKATGNAIDIISPATNDQNITDDNHTLTISYNYQSDSGGYQTPTWAYRIGTSFPNYGSPHGGTQVTGSMSKDNFLSGQTYGNKTVYVALLDQNGNLHNPPVTLNRTLNYQSSGGEYQSPSDGYSSPNGDYSSPDQGYESPDSGYTSPSDGYQSPSDGYSSPNGDYSSPDQGYESPDSGYTSPSDGYQSPSDGYSSPNGDYSSPDQGYSSPDSGYTSSGDGYNQIFVSTTGNNSTGDGSISNPYGTIKYAGDQALPGDTIFVRAGTYQNSDFNDNDIWTGEPVARLSNINGTTGNYITFIPYQNEQVVIEFDGIYGFLIQNSSYIKIQNFIFDGVADNITQQQAEDAWGLYKDTNGVIHDLEIEMGIDIIDPSIIGTSINQPSSSDNTIEKPIEFNGRALVANKSHHIEFIGNTIKNAPSAAIRAQQSDYITITKNKVYDNTFWTTQGVGAITISEATVRPLGDTYTGTKIIITENEVYQNENRLFSWNPTKTFVHFEIDEGTGLFLTRNKDTYAHGEMLIANNLSYKNGASGIVCHYTNDVTIEHNTVFDNATTNHGNPGGIGVNISDNVKILSNISYSKSNKWALGILAEPVTNLVLDYNIVFNNSGSINFIRSTSSNPLTNGWSEMNPLFTDENNYDFSLSNSSAAINNASTQSGQTTDYFGNNRDANPDIGAIEHISTLGIDNPPGNGYNSPGDGYSSPDYGYTSPGGGYSTPNSGYSSPDSIYISYPNIGVLYSSDGNGLQIGWNYQSQSNAMQSVRWAYKLDEDFYGTGASATQVTGTDSVTGSSWLDSVNYGSHTLYVALLDQSTGDPLADDQHSFTYNSGSDPNSSGGSGYQSDDGGTQSGGGGYQSPGDGYQSDISGYNSINITYPTIYNVSDWNSLEIEWTYASGVANQSSPRFGYTIDENITSQGVYINEFNTFNLYGSEWLGSLSDGEHTVYVALLDPTNGSILATDNHLFSLTLSSEPEDPGTSNDDITILNPGSGSVIERNATLSVDLSYASEVSSSESPRWAYKINEDFYSTQTSAIEVNSTSVQGWLDDLEDGEHTVYVALLMTYGGDYILAEDNVTFELVGDDDGVPPYFNFTDTDLSQITGRSDLAEGNYTILKDHNSSDSSYFKIAPVYRDENGYILVEIESSVNSSINFASLEAYLDGYNIEPLGFVDFMPFDFHPIDRIDLNNISELATLSNGYDEVFFQEYTPREWFTYDEFNESSLNESLWDIAYFAGGLAPTHSNGKAVLSGTQSTGNNPYNIPSILETPDLLSGQGNSALFLDDTEAFGIELDVTIPSTGNSQEVGFFIDLIDVNLTHHEIIEFAWRSNGTTWNWEEKSDVNDQTIYRSLEAEIDQTYAVSIIQTGHYTQVFIDEKMIAKINGHFSARAWLIGAFNDNGESFEVSIDNVSLLKEASQNAHIDRYWALSIEGDDQNLDMVVDMAGYVYRGHFEDYWYHLFQLPAYNPKVDEEIPHRDWHEVSYNLAHSQINDLFYDFPVVGDKQLFFTDTEFSLTENNDINASVGHILLSIPELLGDFSYSVTSANHTSQPIPASINQDGLITIPSSIDYEIQSEIRLGVSVVDEFDRGFTESITISIDDVFEDLDGDGEEDHLDADIDGDSFENEEEEFYGFDPRNAYNHPELSIVQTLSAELGSNGVYLLKGRLLSNGGVSLSDLGFEINGKGFNENDRLAVDVNTSEGSLFSIQLLNPAPGETFTYRAFAANVAGKTTGAPRKIKTKISEDWWFGADELEAGWKSNWIGVFLPQSNGWAYHSELGWAFVSPDGSGGLWLWDEGNGWHWTREGIWPFLWSNNTADWLYLMKSGNRVFLYDYSTQSFITDF
ncbi:hypothetical protein N9J83_07450 [Opitutales bacterium]|nr:hypothetical protein [Opitutales bacterium]